MGGHGHKRTCICIDCGERRELSKPDARRERWELWAGGARCRTCSVGPDPSKATLPPAFGPAYTEHIIVACSACSREAESSQEYTDGWHAGIHWTSNPEVIQESRDSLARRVRDPKHPIVPLPLCPGWNQPGSVVRVERREVTL